MEKEYLVKINPDMIYWTIEAENEKQAIEKAIEEITEYFNQGQLTEEDLIIEEI